MITDRPQIGVEHEERFLGLSTLECARVVVAQSPNVGVVQIRAYKYLPDTPTFDNDRIFLLNRADFIKPGRVERFIDEFAPDQNPNKDPVYEGWNVALDSQVLLDDYQPGHIPMLDLRIFKSEEALVKTMKEIRLRTKQIGLHPAGFILETGSSYHYLGASVLTHEQWHKFNYLALTLSVVMDYRSDGVTPNDEKRSVSIVDGKYIGWSGLRGTAGLRLTTRGSKTFTPRVVAVLQ